MGKLTEKQEKFKNNIIEGMTQRDAYLDAYEKSVNWNISSVDTAASRLYAKLLPSINEIKQEVVEESKRTRSDLLNTLYKALEMAMGVEVTPTTVKGMVQGIGTLEETEVKQADLKAAATIANQIAKLSGWDTPSTVINNIVNPSKMADDDRQKRIEELRKKGGK